MNARQQARLKKRERRALAQGKGFRGQKSWGVKERKDTALKIERNIQP